MAMYLRRQTRGGVKVETQPCTSGDGYVLQAMDIYYMKHSHVLRCSTDENRDRTETAMYSRRQARSGVKVETQPCTPGDRREVGSG